MYIEYDTTYPWLPSRAYYTDPENRGQQERVAEVLYDNSGGYGLGPSKTSTKYADGQYAEQHMAYELQYGNIASETDANGAVTEYTYDQYGRVKKILHPSYQKDGGMYQVIEEYTYYRKVKNNNAPGDNNYYAFARIVKYDTNEAESYKNSVQLQDVYYDDYGNSIYVEDEIGDWKYFYDSALRPVAMQDPRDFGTQAYTQQISYDGWSRALTATDRMGNVQKADYKSLRTDYSFVPAGSTAAENHYSELEDLYGNVVEVRNYPNGMSETEYESISYTYDLAGNMTQMTDANGNVTEYAYDKLNQLVQTEQADGSVIEASYTKFGTPLEIRQASDGEEYTIARSYDDRGLEISTEQKGKNIPTRPWNYTYNAAGQLLSMEDPSGGVRSYGYDDAGNVVTEQLGGEERDRTYNYLGQTTKVVKKEHGNTQNHAEYLYNEETGWLVEKEIASSATVEYEYTDMGSVDMVKVSNGVMRNYIRDDLERTTSIVIDGGDSFGYEYYGDGAIKAVIYPTGDIRTDYTYDNANRVKTIVSKKGSTVLHQASYTYDGNGNILTITGTDPVTYTYDSMNRLASETRNGTTTTYEYDSRDNLVKETTGSTVTEYTYAGDNRLTQKETNGTITTYEYDLNGNLIGDSAGNVCGYDEENRLVYASTDVGNMQYTITAEGLRSGKSGSVSGASYVTDIDGKVIKENEAEIIVGHQALAKKIGDAYYYYIYNAHGDVIMMVDESGNIVNQYEYDAWGKITEETETVPNSIKYAGEYYDEETGFIYLRNRMYDPETRRFTSEDPARDQLNWYSYCGNNPVIFVDPWGLDAIIITDIDGAYAQGHISGIFQDSVGNWYYFYWGNKEAFVQQVTDNSAMNSLDSFNKWLNENNIYSGKYDYATYIAGDFTESFLHAVEISKNYSTDQYNLLFRNCMQVTWECILKGKFKDGTPIGNMVTLNIGIRPNSNYRFIGYAFYNFDFTYAGYWKTINDALWSARQRLATESTNWGRNVVQKRIDLLEKLYS